MTVDRHRVYDSENDYTLLVKEHETRVSVGRPDLGAHSFRDCYRDRNGEPVVPEHAMDYITKGLELADIPYSVTDE